MTKEEVVRSFQSGFDCGQTVLRHCAAQLGLDEKTASRISTGFGGGSGRGETCGAVIGAYLALGLKYGCDESGETGAEQKLQSLRKNAEFCEEFQKKYPGFTCREILGIDLSTPEGQAANRQRKLTASVCPQLVADVTELLDQLLK